MLKPSRVPVLLNPVAPRGHDTRGRESYVELTIGAQADRIGKTTYRRLGSFSSPPRSKERVP